METQTVKHGGEAYNFPIIAGKVCIEPARLSELADALKLILYFSAVCRHFLIEKSAFTEIVKSVGKWLDRTGGGLTTVALDEFGGDLEVLAAAEEHRASEARAKGKLPISGASVGSSSPEKVPETTVGGATNSKQSDIPAGDIAGDDDPFEVHMLDVARLKDNLLNATIYSEAITPGLLASIETNGVKVPIRVTPDMLIIDGHQRTHAAIAGGWKKVPVIIEDVPKEKQLLALLEYNRYRDKTIIERLREYRAYFQIEKDLAEQRSGARTDLGVKLPHGQEYGKSRDLAATKVGMSGSSAARGLKILEELEKREAGGCLDGVPEVREAFNKGVNGAYKVALKHGWVDAAVKARKTSSPEAEIDGADSKEASPESALEEKLVPDWITDAEIARALKVQKLSPGETKVMATTIKLIRPAIYTEIGTIMTKDAGEKLRRLARLLSLLAEKCESEGESE